jgi:hypothetical protein
MTFPPLLRRTRLLPLLLAAAASSAAHAALLVEQWQGGGAGNNGLAGVDAVIASRPADVSGIWAIIDFTDDPGGFAGEIPGSNPWPLATLLAQNGTGATANSDFAARISGSLNISVADTYHFRTYSDDGVRLRVGNTTVISDNGYHPESVNTGRIILNPGSYLIDLIFFENGGEASLEFSMAQGNNPFGHVGALPGFETSAPAVPEASTWAAGLALAGVGVATCRRARHTRRG